VRASPVLSIAVLLAVAFLAPVRSGSKGEPQNALGTGAFGAKGSIDEPRVIQRKRAHEPGRGRHAVQTVGAISFEGANPRHKHEWAIFKEIRLPPGKVLIPGVIDSCTNYIEHPDLVAQRIVRFAELVGRENVIAGTDCGFATFAAYTPIVPAIAWAKLQSLSEGARMASQQLWSS
jgi:hypothetical protein